MRNGYRFVLGVLLAWLLVNGCAARGDVGTPTPGPAATASATAQSRALRPSPTVAATATQASAVPTETAAAPSATATRPPRIPSATPSPSPSDSPTRVPPTSFPSPTPFPTPAFSTEPNVRSLAITPDEPPVFYAIIDRALQRSVDRGVSWTPLPIPTKDDGRPAYPFAITIDYRHPQTQYLATTAGIFRREGEGEWRLVNSINAVSLAVDFVDSNVLWAGVYRSTEYGAVLMRSDDGGKTWAKADTGMSGGYRSAVDTILVDPNDPNTLYAVLRDSGRFGWPSGWMYRGTREGQWQRVSLGEFERAYAEKAESCIPNGLAFDPVGDALYVGCDAYYYNKGHGWLLRTDQPRALDPQAIPWEVVHEFDPVEGYWYGYTRPLAVDAREPWSLYVSALAYGGDPPAEHRRLWVSHDQGRSWE